MTHSSSPSSISDRLHRLFPPGAKVNLWDLEATVTKPIDLGRIGQVKFQGTWWSAISKQEITLDSDRIVYVVDVEGMILIVQPTPPANLSMFQYSTA